MADFHLKIWDDEYEKITYYSVCWDNNSSLEIDKFIDTFNDAQSNYYNDFEQIMDLIADIGDNGIRPNLFRPENAALALPPKNTALLKFGTYNFSLNRLRLYCFYIENIVVLFNGGIKTAQTAQNSPSLSLKFQEANIFAQRLDKAFNDKIIVVNSAKRRIEWSNAPDDDVIIL